MKLRLIGCLTLYAFLCTICSIKAHAWEYVKPVCWPDSLSEVRWRHYDTLIVVLWYCDTPRAIARYRYAFNTSKSGPSVNITGKTDTELAALHKQVINRELTLTEQDILNQLEAEQGVKLKVINPGYTTAPLYTRNADGTRGPVSTERATVGETCGRMRLISITNGKEVGTSYYEYKPGLYARCSVSGAVSK